MLFRSNSAAGSVCCAGSFDRSTMLICREGLGAPTPLVAATRPFTRTSPILLPMVRTTSPRPPPPQARRDGFAGIRSSLSMYSGARGTISRFGRPYRKKGGIGRYNPLRSGICKPNRSSTLSSFHFVKASASRGCFCAAGKTADSAMAKPGRS